MRRESAKAGTDMRPVATCQFLLMVTMIATIMMTTITARYKSLCCNFFPIDLPFSGEQNDVSGSHSIEIFRFDKVILS